MTCARPKVTLPALLRGPSLTCLDAPLVAVVWQATLAHAFGARISFAARAALFFTTWAIYLFDRIADAASLAPEADTSVRQAFAIRFRAPLRALFAGILVADTAAVACLDTRLVAVGALVGIACAVYLTTNRVADRLWRVLPVKELTIGVLFALGTAAPLLPSSRAPVLASVMLFATLCALNCATIAAWERSLDARQRKTSLVTRYPRVANALPLSFALVAALATQLPSAIASPLVLSALLLGVLHVARERFAVEDRTALADLVLLAPLVFAR